MKQLDFVVLIPFYNDLEGLQRALNSIAYPCARYGILIVDDGSDKPLTLNVLNVNLPEQTEIIRLTVNGGITAALNAGLRRLESSWNVRFIARLDCGDICTSDRFMRQVAFLNAHSEIDLLGSWVRFRHVNGKYSYTYKTPVDQKAIERGMHFRNLFIHPSVMWRASAMMQVSRYPYDLPHAEDYGFFYQLLKHGKAAILPQELVTCQVNPNGLSIKYRRQQLKSRLKTVMRYRDNVFLGLLGALKLKLLQFIPFQTVLRLKAMVY